MYMILEKGIILNTLFAWKWSLWRIKKSYTKNFSRMIQVRETYSGLAGGTPFYSSHGYVFCVGFFRKC